MNEKFVTAASYPGKYLSRDINFSEQMFPLARLCGGNKSSRIAFTLVSATTGKVLHRAITSIDELLAGGTALSAGGACKLNVE